MSIFTVFIIVVLAPLLAKLAKIAAYALFFPIALIGLGLKALIFPQNKKAQRA